MNKEILSQQIANLEAKLAELKAEVNKPAPIINYWQPGLNERHWYVNRYGYVMVNTTASKSYIGKGHHRVFQTQKQAQAYAEYVKAEEILKAEIARLNEGWWPDWNDTDTTKYVVAPDTEFGSLKRHLYHYTKFSPSFMYLKSGELTEQLIKTHSKELKTYLTY